MTKTLLTPHTSLQQVLARVNPHNESLELYTVPNDLSEPDIVKGDIVLATAESEPNAGDFVIFETPSHYMKRDNDKGVWIDYYGEYETLMGVVFDDCGTMLIKGRCYSYRLAHMANVRTILGIIRPRENLYQYKFHNY